MRRSLLLSPILVTANLGLFRSNLTECPTESIWREPTPTNPSLNTDHVQEPCLLRQPTSPRGPPTVRPDAGRSDDADACGKTSGRGGCPAAAAAAAAAARHCGPGDQRGGHRGQEEPERTPAQREKGPLPPLQGHDGGLGGHHLLQHEEEARRQRGGSDVQGAVPEEGVAEHCGEGPELRGVGCRTGEGLDQARRYGREEACQAVRGVLQPLPLLRSCPGSAPSPAGTA